ncbi:MAG: asparaginase, partial [bacterium]
MSNVVAKVVRNGRVESVHRGHVAVVDAHGNLLASAGDPTCRTYMRSAAKPFQFMPLLVDGLDRVYHFTSKELAIMISSHNGEPLHVQAVASILKKADLSPNHLRCGFHLPLHKASADDFLKQETAPSPLFNNCSGKHAGMLVMSRHHGWPLESYLDPAHPVQVRIKETIARFSVLDEQDIEVGVDGCSAPVFYLPVSNMARMFANLSAGQEEATARVFDLMAGHPEMIAGTGRFDTDLMRVTKGRMVSKVGAEGIRCVGMRGKPPLGIALKVEDG